MGPGMMALVGLLAGLIVGAFVGLWVGVAIAADDTAPEDDEPGPEGWGV